MTHDATPSELLRRNDLRAKKSWGQCFLGDSEVLDRIAGACHLSADDTAVELGAGLGHLTRALAATGAQIVAVERDRDLVEIFRRNCILPNVRLVAANAAKLDFAEVAGIARPVVAGNLPYQLTSPILFELLEQQTHVARAIFLLQKEVVERLASPPGTRNCGILSVLLASCATVEYLFDVPAHQFTPRPRVDSAVVRIEFFDPPKYRIHSHSNFVRLVKAAFSQRRKMLRGALKSDPNLFQINSIEHVLARAGVDATARAEQLTLEQFIALENALLS